MGERAQLLNQLEETWQQPHPVWMAIKSLANMWEELAHIEALTLFGREPEEKAGQAFDIQKESLRQALQTKVTIKPLPSLSALALSQAAYELSKPRSVEQ